MKKISLFLALLMIVASCSVQKRRYQKGFYVNRLHHKESGVTSQSSKQARAQEPAARSLTLSEIRTGDAVLDADAQSLQPPIVKKRSFLRDPQDSCDILLFRDGSELRARVSEIGPDDVKYKRCENPEGPFYVTKKADLFMIKYANGTREVMKTPQAAEPLPAYRQFDYKKQRRVVHPLAPVALATGALSIIAAYISLVLIAAFVTFPPILLLILVLLPIIAVVTGKTAMNRIREQPDVYKGKGLAIPGFIMGLVMLGIYVMIGLIILAFLGI